MFCRYRFLSNSSWGCDDDIHLCKGDAIHPGSRSLSTKKNHCLDFCWCKTLTQPTQTMVLAAKTTSLNIKVQVVVSTHLQNIKMKDENFKQDWNHPKKHSVFWASGSNNGTWMFLFFTNCIYEHQPLLNARRYSDVTSKFWGRNTPELPEGAVGGVGGRSNVESETRGTHPGTPAYSTFS